MEKNPIAWGLDIGHSSIKAVKLSRSGGGATVMGYAIEPIVTSEDVDREGAVVRALEALATREEFGTVPVVAAVSGRQIYARTINIPVINPKKVDKMVELEARQQIPGNFDEVEWSYHLSPSPDGASNDVALFAAKRDLIEELVRKCKQVNINLVGVSVSSLALYNFVRFDQEFPDDETVIILDVGAENTDLVLYQGDTLWMRTLAVSGNDITKAFMKKFRVSFEEAETLKRQIGESRQADKIFKVIEASLNELTSEVVRSLGFYKQTSPKAKLENIVISGNTFRLPNLSQYLADRLQFAVISLEDLEKVEVAGTLEREHFLQDLPSLGVAMGLALQGVGEAKANVNLMPSTMRLERLLRTKRWAAVAILAIIAVTILVRYLVIGSVLTENSGLIRQIEDYAKKNADGQKVSEQVLEQVGPKAATLSGYDPFGTQKGISHAVMEGVLGVIQKAIIDGGPVNTEAKPEDQGGDPALQAIYLEKIELPAFEFRADPFRPLAQPRKVTVEVRLPRDAKDISQEFVSRLKDIPVPEYLKAIHAGAKLFSNVEARDTRPADDNWHYIDKSAVDPETGDLKPRQEERKVKVTVATFECTLSGLKEVTP